MIRKNTKTSLLTPGQLSIKKKKKNHKFKLIAYVDRYSSNMKFISKKIKQSTTTDVR